jgi:hypothetical protein
MVSPKYAQERDRLRRKVGIKGMRLDKLLGDTRKIEAMIEFIEDFGRFDF